MSENTLEKQPLINKRAATRFAIGLFLIAGLIFGYQWYQSRGSDLNNWGQADTADQIAALELPREGGVRAVLIAPDGTVTARPDYVAGTSDRDIAWRPDGNVLVFTNDKEIRRRRAYNLYRWNLAREVVEPRTDGTIAWSSPSFSGSTTPDELKNVLAVAGGNVWLRNLSDFTGQRIIPYNAEAEADDQGKDIQTDLGGDAQPMSIKKARWTKGKEFVIGVRRIDAGEALIVQPMTGPDEKRKPSLIAVGDHVDFEVNPVTGMVFFCLRGFQWPNPAEVPKEYMKNGRAVKPIENYIGVYDPATNKSTVIAGTKERKKAFGDIAVSPNGATLAFVVGSNDVEGRFKAEGMMAMPADARGGQVRQLVPGEISEVSWHPNNVTLAYIKREGASRNVYTISLDGKGEKRITSGQQNYATPKFSPQLK